VRSETRRKAHARNYTRPSAFDTWLRGLPQTIRPQPAERRSREPPNRALIMKIELFAGHHEARQALVLSVVGVTAIMLIANLILMILY
jgi:hypothetical protein